MITRSACLFAVVLILSFSAVCQAAQTNQINQTVQIAQINVPGGRMVDQAIFLGAGDDLGRACFTRYVAVVRAQQQRQIRQVQGPASAPPAPAPLIARIDQSRISRTGMFLEQFTQAMRQVAALVGATS